MARKSVWLSRTRTNADEQPERLSMVKWKQVIALLCLQHHHLSTKGPKKHRDIVNRQQMVAGSMGD